MGVKGGWRMSHKWKPEVIEGGKSPDYKPLGARFADLYVSIRYNVKLFRGAYPEMSRLRSLQVLIMAMAHDAGEAHAASELPFENREQFLAWLIQCLESYSKPDVYDALNKYYVAGRSI